MSNNINNNLTAFKSYLDDQIPESDNFHQTSIHEITKIMKNLKNRNSVGWDNILTNILKTNVMTLAPILSNLINKFLAQGLFPQSLKRAKILPIFKSKDKLNIANSRPISILLVISKVYEKFFIVDSTQLKIKAVATVDCGSIMCCDIGAIRQRHG